MSERVKLMEDGMEGGMRRLMMMMMMLLLRLQLFGLMCLLHTLSNISLHHQQF